MQRTTYVFPSSVESQFLEHVRLFVWLADATGWRRHVWPSIFVRRLLIIDIEKDEDGLPALVAIVKSTYRGLLDDLWCAIRRQPYHNRGVIWLVLRRGFFAETETLTEATIGIEDNDLEDEYKRIRDQLLPWQVATIYFEDLLPKRQYRPGRPRETTEEVTTLGQRVADIRREYNGQRLSRQKIATILEESFGLPGITREQIRYAEQLASRPQTEPLEDLEE